MKKPPNARTMPTDIFRVKVRFSSAAARGSTNIQRSLHDRHISQETQTSNLRWSEALHGRPSWASEAREHEETDPAKNAARLLVQAGSWSIKYDRVQ